MQSHSNWPPADFVHFMGVGLLQVVELVADGDVGKCLNKPLVLSLPLAGDECNCSVVHLSRVYSMSLHRLIQ